MGIIGAAVGVAFAGAWAYYLLTNFTGFGQETAGLGMIAVIFMFVTTAVMALASTVRDDEEDA